MSFIDDYSHTYHKLAVKYVPAYLPEAKKPYNLKPVHQHALDIHEIAGMADSYKIGIDPRVIEEGLKGGLRLIERLAADGYRIKTSLFNLRIRVPGEYEGSEISLPDGVHPVVRLGPSAEYRKYVKERVQIEFDGLEPPVGIISGFLDIDEDEYKTIFVPGNQFKVKGRGIRVMGSDPACGVFFVNANDPLQEVRASRIADNTQTKIIGICPNTTWQYSKLVVRTQFFGSTTRFLKTVRVIESSFMIEKI